MEELKKDNGILFGLHYGLIKPLEKPNGKQQYELTEKGVEVVKVASIYLTIGILQLLFMRVKK